LAALAVEVMATRAAAATGLRVRTELHPAIAAHADPTLVASLIGNLLDNAIRYNVEGGRVDLATRSFGDRVVFAISNTGPVVPADAVETILRPFHRLAPPRLHGNGSGLGLAIV